MNRGFGPWHRRFLRWHVLCYAVGLALDTSGAAGVASMIRLAPTAGSAAAAAATAAVAAAAKLALGLGVALQVAALHHLSPAMAFARGYSDGISKAFAFTGLLLSRLLYLMPGGARAGAAAKGLWALVPAFLHGFFRAAAMSLGM